MFEHKPRGDFDRKFLSYATVFFKINGLWRTDKRPWWLEPYVYIGRFNVFFTFGWGFIFAVWTGIYLYVQEGNINSALSWATYSLAWALMQVKYVTMCRNETKIRKFISKLEEWSAQYPDKTNVARALKICNQLLCWGICSITMVGITYVGLSVLFLEKRTLPIKTMFTFGLDVLKTPIYEIYWIIQNIGVLSNVTPAVAFDTCYVGIILTSAMILRNLNNVMRAQVVGSDLSPQDKLNSLINCIQKYTEIREMLDEVRELFLLANLAHFLYNYSSAAFTLLELSKVRLFSAEYTALFVGFFVVAYTLLTHCESGQLLSDEMANFNSILYESDWYMETKTFQKVIYLSLMATQGDYYPSAGKMMNLSRDTEKRVMNAVFAFYICLTQLNYST